MKKQIRMPYVFFILMLLSVLISAKGFAESDAYEPDNTLRNAGPILLNDTRPDVLEPVFDGTQSHNFYHTGDEDWVKFYAIENKIYHIEVKEPGAGCNAVIGIYDISGDLVIAEEVNDESAGIGEYASFLCRADGIYYARIRQSSSAEYGEDTDYKLVLYLAEIQEKGFLYGTVTPCVAEAIVTTTGKAGTLLYTQKDEQGNEICMYGSPHPASPPLFRLRVEVEGYKVYESKEDFTVNEGGATEEKVTLTPVADIPKYHSADYNPPDHDISLSEMLRVNQFYNIGGYYCDSNEEDGYAVVGDDHTCVPHTSDYNPQDWSISLGEFLRLLQLFKAGKYHSDGGEDGFAPGK